MPGAVVHLPCCFALKSTRHESYLRYVHEDRDETNYGQLQLNGEDAVNPFTRFDSEPSLLHQGLVHIRCRYNRKYWVPRQRGGGWWIVADAHEPEEDLDSPNCTLIKPIVSVTDANDDATSEGVNVMTVRFVHAGHGKEDTRMTTFSMDCCMRVAAGEPDDGGDAFTVLNLGSSPRRLPRFVVFKGHNGLYLRAVTIQGRNHLQFSARDPGDPRAVHQVSYSNGAFFVVRNIHLQMVWNRETGAWILASRSHPIPVAPSSSWFAALDVKDYFAISPYAKGGDTGRSLLFLKSSTRDGVTNCLDGRRRNMSITAEARIKVEEAVLDREIFNVEYRLSEARIYDTSILTMATTAALNYTSRENTKTLILAYEESEMSTWDATLELKLGVKTRIRAGFPKLGLGGEVNVSADFFGDYNWGETRMLTLSHSFAA
ncbi:hypothetical protein ACQJBY_072581 [Aegilops geniculata]